MLRKSVRLVNAFLSAVVLSCLLAVLRLGVVPGFPSELQPMAVGIIVFLNMLLLSGSFGLLADMAGGRHDYCTGPVFLENVRRYIMPYLALATVVVAAHFALFAFFHSERLPPLSLFQSLTDGLVFGVLAIDIVRRKYEQRFQAAAFVRAVASSWPSLGAVYLGYIFFSWGSTQDRVDLGPGIFWFAFLAQYCQILLFALWLEVCLEAMDCGVTVGGKELILINPLGGGLWWTLAALFYRSYPPFFVILKALTPSTYRFSEYNHRLWNERYFRKDVLVAITCMTSNSADAYRIAQGFRQAGAKVVMGGAHVSCLPEEALEFCDSVVVGAAEGVWEEVVRDYEAGCLRRVYNGSLPSEKMEQVDRYLLSCPPEQIKDFIETTRGCKFACDFCLAPVLMKGFITRSPETIASLLKKVRNRFSTIMFLDGNLFSDPAHMEKVLTAIKPIGIKWYGSLTIDVAANDRMLALMKESGCRGVLVGYEIFGGEGSVRQDGKFALGQRYLELSRKIQKAGIMLKAHFIMGFERDNWSSFVKMWGFAFRLSPSMIGFSFLQPFPGTGVHRKLVAEDRIRNLNWRGYDLCRVAFDHPRMSGRWLEMFLPGYLGALYFLCSKSGRWMIMFLLMFAGSWWLGAARG